MSHILHTYHDNDIEDILSRPTKVSIYHDTDNNRTHICRQSHETLLLFPDPTYILRLFTQENTER